MIDFKSYLGGFFYILKKYNQFKKFDGPIITIVNYHGIPNDSIKNFQKQIHWLAKNYEIIDCQTFQSFLKGEVTLEGKKVFITFDDGFVSSYNVAKTILDPKGIRAHFFLPSDFVGDKNFSNWKKYVSNNLYKSSKKGSRWFPFQKPMIDNEINNLINSGHTIGSHTVSHINLNSIKNEKELNYELKKSKDDLESNFNVEINSLAFPFGGIDYIDISALKAIKNYYSFCYSNIRGSNDKNTSPYTIYRQDISPNIPHSYMGFIIEGGLDWYWASHKNKLVEMYKKAS